MSLRAEVADDPSRSKTIENSPSAQLLGILPIPPLQTPGVVYGVPGKINGAPEDVQHTSIDMPSPKGAQPLVHLFRVRIAQLGYPLKSDVHEVPGDARTDPGDVLKII